jgi:homocysteine S-methyltransferase
MTIWRKRKMSVSVRDISEKKVIVFDGAMGTYFVQEHRNYGRPCEMANIDNADFVKKIHRDYIEAGCDAIKTNTFQVNPLNHVYTADEDLMDRVLKAGWNIACEAAEGTDTAVFADIGPVPAGAEADENDKAEAFKKVCSVFIENGAENFIFETNSSDEGIVQAAGYIKERVPEAFIIVSFAVQPDGYTRDGLYINDIAERLAKCISIDAVGLNCVSSALHMRGLIEGISETVNKNGKLLSVMPNAGYPKVINDRVFYDSDPAYFAEQTCMMTESGVSVVGGCCGTAKEHISLLAKAVSAGTEAPAKVRVSVKPGSDRPSGIMHEMTENEHNLFARKLESGRKVIAVELDPPRNADSSKYMAGAWTLKAAGVDAITIADCATARASMDSSVMACKLRRELGIDAIPHMTCRDRNLNATKALLLALSTEGVANVLAVTGDPVPSAERDEVKSVFQFNSRMLASYIRSLNENEFSRPLKIYGALNINVKNFDRELDRTVKKVENGMSGFLTQPVLTAEAAENLKRAYETLKPLGAKLLGGIIPVVSARNARFMNSEISGINVDSKIIDMYEGKDRDECTELAVRISTEIAEHIKDFTDGYYLMTPFSRTDIMSRIVAYIKENIA